MALFAILLLLFSFEGTVSQIKEHENILEFLKSRKLHNVLGDRNEIISSYEIVKPILTDHNGIHQYRSERDAGLHNEVYYSLNGLGENFKLKLYKNSHIIDPDIKYSVRHENGLITTENINQFRNCMYHGASTAHEGSSAAFVTCNGLTGLIRTDTGNYFVEPLRASHFGKRSNDDGNDDFQHVIYKTQPKENFCGASKKENADDLEYHSLLNKITKRATSQGASASSELIIETSIFADKELYKKISGLYPKSNPDEEVLRYILAFINSVDILFNLPSLTDKLVKFVLIKLEIFKTDKPGFNITDDGDEYLDRFCLWQKNLNKRNDEDPDHWDHAFMLTGLDIQTEDSGHSVAGIAPVSAMCTLSNSCTLSEGSRFSGVLIAVHEAGHNLGMHHDGNHNDCDKNNYIMAPVLNTHHVQWSSCSRDYMKNYLKFSQTVCLLDKRTPSDPFNFKDLPGQQYTGDEQCKNAYGLDAKVNEDYPIEDICMHLECLHNKYLKGRHAALEGTYCGTKKWCINGSCVAWSKVEPKVVDGKWSNWSPFTKCASNCIEGGVGITYTTRKCDNPRPSNGGKLCAGDSIIIYKCSDSMICKQKRSINSFSKAVCLNAPRKQELYKGGWTRFYDDEFDGCKVYCKKEGTNLYTYWGVKYHDGTDCSDKGESSKYCIQGVCMTLVSNKRNKNAYAYK